tara:strand:+ start:3242 stop:3541 length:300 start_codon:yes stop_codon:yes gene_type:complete
MTTFDIHDFCSPCIVASYFELPSGSIAAIKIRKVFSDYGVLDLLTADGSVSDEISRFRLSAAVKAANALLSHLPDHERKQRTLAEQLGQGRNHLALDAV